MKLKQDSSDIGQNLKRLRLQAGYNCSDLVIRFQLLGIDFSYGIYRKVEQNRCNVKVRELTALKEIFGVEYNEFFKAIFSDDSD
ncbi:MAG: helix-turn-helix transcriptional regulator [Lachnospiraceae bacterium]|nr:helix-turn-helix transcriptional regulator [Lachnospiraceae bacterium]